MLQFCIGINFISFSACETVCTREILCVWNTAAYKFHFVASLNEALSDLEPLNLLIIKGYGSINP